MNRIRKLFFCSLLFVFSACAVAAVEYTDRGVKREVKGNLAQVNHDARDALEAMGIRITGTGMKNSGQEQDLTGKAGKTTVSITMTQAGPDATNVEVIAKEGTFDWNKDYAKGVLNRIVVTS